MPALIGFLLILGLAMMMFGAIDKEDLPRNIARIAENAASRPTQSAAVLPGTEGFGAPGAPSWQNGWKLFKQDGALYIAAKLAGQYQQYDSPEIYLACAPGGTMTAMLDTRLPLASSKLKIGGASHSMSVASGTWYRVNDQALKALLGSTSVALRFGDDWTSFALPPDSRAMAGTLLGACERAGKALVADR